jgi:hypothetical protein
MAASERVRSVVRVVLAVDRSVRPVVAAAFVSAMRVPDVAVRTRPRAGAVAAHACEARARHRSDVIDRARRGSAIGSRSSNRIGSGGGTGLSGGAVEKKPCSSSLQDPSPDPAGEASSESWSVGTRTSEAGRTSFHQAS